MVKLYSRDYLEGLTKNEEFEYNQVLQKEKEGHTGLGRKNLYAQYPLAVRCYLSLFPNNHLDILDLRDANETAMIDKNDKFKQLISSAKIKERDILNYINKAPAFHIIGSVLRGCNFRFGHHSAYLFPEFPLGTSYKADYLIIGKNSGGYEFVFVELESLTGNITIGQGDLGEVFRKGIAQVKEWNRWLQENYSTLSEFFEKHIKAGECLPKEFLKYDDTRIHYVVIAGKRIDFNETTYRIAREHKDSDKISLLHYDNLYDFACQIIHEPTY